MEKKFGCAKTWTYYCVVDGCQPRYDSERRIISLGLPLTAFLNASYPISPTTQTTKFGDNRVGLSIRLGIVLSGTRSAFRKSRSTAGHVRAVLRARSDWLSSRKLYPQVLGRKPKNTSRGSMGELYIRGMPICNVLTPRYRS